METIKETNTQYTNDLDGIEAQITQKEQNDQEGAILVKKEPFISEMCCAKMCIAITGSLILSPFAICDVYYATTDDTCVTQSQSSHNLTIILQSYLLASGIITFIFIGLFDFCLIVLDFNIIKPDKNADDIGGFLSSVLNVINYFFSLAWLILGCVLFWAYTDIANCSQSVHDYLFARFIIGIIGYVARLTANNE